MKIAVPLRGERFSEHFGGAEMFALYTVDAAAREVCRRDDLAPPEHGRGIFPMWLKSQGATVILAGGMGPRASDLFARHGITVMLGVDGGDPDELVRDYLHGRVASTGELCHEHGFHDCSHHAAHGGRCGDQH